MIRGRLYINNHNNNNKNNNNDKDNDNDNDNDNNNNKSLVLAHYIENLNALTKNSNNLGSRVPYNN